MSSRDDRRDDDLEERLDELEDVLSELRRDLQETERDRRGPLRPPRLSELIRFTEQYTIPTLIALLETTIKSLELLQGTLRLADPNRSLTDEAGGTTDRIADVRDGASAGLARSLSELRSALSEADLPEETASRSIIQDARDLTAEIESRIDEGRREADAARRSRTSGDRRADDRNERRADDRNERRADDRNERRADDRNERQGNDRSDEGRGKESGTGGRTEGGIRIDVTDPDDDPADDEGDGTSTAESSDDPDDPTPEVDVESELESIKRQLGEDEELSEGNGSGATADGRVDSGESTDPEEIGDTDGNDGSEGEMSADADGDSEEDTDADDGSGESRDPDGSADEDDHGGN